jgi:hypothetical protein
MTPRHCAWSRGPQGSSQQAGNGPGQQTGSDRVEHPAQREGLRHPSVRDDSYLKLKPHPSSRQRKCMERIDERIKSLLAPMVRQPVR